MSAYSAEMLEACRTVTLKIELHEESGQQDSAEGPTSAFCPSPSTKRSSSCETPVRDSPTEQVSDWNCKRKSHGSPVGRSHTRLPLVSRHTTSVTAAAWLRVRALPDMACTATRRKPFTSPLSLTMATRWTRGTGYSRLAQRGILAFAGASAELSLIIIIIIIILLLLSPELRARVVQKDIIVQVLRLLPSTLPLRVSQLSNFRVGEGRGRGGVTHALAHACVENGVSGAARDMGTRSSLWAKAQSTGSTGVSAHGVLSLSARACTGRTGEGAVLVLDEVAAEDYILTTAGVDTTDPKRRSDDMMASVKDVSARITKFPALGAEEVFQTGHLLLQLTHQPVAGILVDHGVAADLFGAVCVSADMKGGVIKHVTQVLVRNTTLTNMDVLVLP
ncbi:hypothetical protein EYF80_015637 [Liparis tanakae]|uniref:Uncharacterized protein n=1 Tax=Liparis tanakae TaxID=230148 RepID=A0A4Z2I9W6_9TELE|nr:hypothetical protein EYF80_015637 [Liparis tanakae]